jgi:hypothetical protein
LESISQEAIRDESIQRIEAGARRQEMESIDKEIMEAETVTAAATEIRRRNVCQR